MSMIAALPNERDLVNGDQAKVAIADLDGQPHVFVNVTAEVPDRHLLDAWILPADPTLLRGIARDLSAAADRLGTL